METNEKDAPALTTSHHVRSFNLRAFLIGGARIIGHAHEEGDFETQQRCLMKVGGDPSKEKSGLVCDWKVCHLISILLFRSPIFSS